eukprot:2667555-Pyramimonas_sp.AAC.1
MPPLGSVLNRSRDGSSRGAEKLAGRPVRTNENAGEGRRCLELAHLRAHTEKSTVPLGAWGQQHFDYCPFVRFFARDLSAG